mgnify:CR=1 FL=1
MGVVVLEVQDKTPAARLGVKRGDIVLALNNETVKSVAQLVGVLDSDSALFSADFRAAEGARVGVLVCGSNAQISGCVRSWSHSNSPRSSSPWGQPCRQCAFESER